MSVSTRQQPQTHKYVSNNVVTHKKKTEVKEWSAQYPDLSPTENIWGEIKNTVFEAKVTIPMAIQLNVSSVI